MPPARWSLDLSPLAPPRLETGHAVAAALVALYLAPSVLDLMRPTWLGGIVFYTHEAGHVLFSPFGTFMTIAGGTILQLAVPVAFAVSFVRQGQPFSAAITLFWLAMSLLDAARYAGDAIALEGMLSGSWMTGQEELEEHGETRHDWRNMLEMFGLLAATPLVAGALRAAGTVVFAGALYLSLLTAGVPVPKRLAFGRAPGRSRPTPRPAPSRPAPSRPAPSRRPGGPP